MKHPASHRLSAYLDGGLSPDQGREIEEHLRECRDCAELLGDLDAVRSQARDLPDRLPDRDLWPDIARAIEEDALQDPDVIRLHPGVPSTSPRRRMKFGIPIPHAAAAGLVLAMVSGAAGARLARVPSPEVPEVTVALSAEATWVSLVGEASPDLATSAREVARLEAILAGNRDDLDSTTATILEKNLAVIDRAIRESLAALQVDPGNLFLETHLERSIQAKGEYLRDTALLVGWIS